MGYMLVKAHLMVLICNCSKELSVADQTYFIDPSERNFLICGTSVILVPHSEKSLPQLLMVGVTILLLAWFILGDGPSLWDELGQRTVARLIICLCTHTNVNTSEKADHPSWWVIHDGSSHKTDNFIVIIVIIIIYYF